MGRSTRADCSLHQGAPFITPTGANPRTYIQSPTLTEYGDIAAITGIFGAAFTGDVLIDLNGEVVQEGNLSIDACLTEDFEDCEIAPEAALMSRRGCSLLAGFQK